MVMNILNFKGMNSRSKIKQVFVVRQKSDFPEDIALWLVSGSAHKL